MTPRSSVLYYGDAGHPYLHRYQTMTTCPFKQYNDYKINWQAAGMPAPKPATKTNRNANTDDLVVVKYKA